MGTIDLPTMIDYITQVTGEQRMHYVGHSQGTTSFLIMCSERREYNARIISAHLLAPIAFMGRLFSPFVRAAAFFQNTIDVNSYTPSYPSTDLELITVRCKHSWNL